VDRLGRCRWLALAPVLACLDRVSLNRSSTTTAASRESGQRKLTLDAGASGIGEKRCVAGAEAIAIAPGAKGARQKTPAGTASEVRHL
jgi:hypothetical protein